MWVQIKKKMSDVHLPAPREVSLLYIGNLSKQIETDIIIYLKKPIKIILFNKYL